MSEETQSPKRDAELVGKEYNEALVRLAQATNLKYLAESDIATNMERVLRLTQEFEALNASQQSPEGEPK
jgi:hypothetical protein